MDFQFKNSLQQAQWKINSALKRIKEGDLRQAEQYMKLASGVINGLLANIEGKFLH